MPTSPPAAASSKSSVAGNKLFNLFETNKLMNSTLEAAENAGLRVCVMGRDLTVRSWMATSGTALVAARTFLLLNAVNLEASQDEK